MSERFALQLDNATELERALAALEAEVADIDPSWIGALWNADACPLEMLEPLAWALSVDVWDSGWPEERKRRAIREAPLYHAVKGTDLAVSMAVALLGCRTTTTEWWETTPPGRRGTFRIVAYVAELGDANAPVVTPEKIAAVRAAIMAAKPKSRAFRLETGIALSGRPGTAAASAFVEHVDHQMTAITQKSGQADPRVAAGAATVEAGFITLAAVTQKHGGAVPRSAAAAAFYEMIVLG